MRATPAASPAASERVEQSKERLARDIVQAKSKLRHLGDVARRRAGRTAVVAAAVLVGAGIVTMAVRARRGRHRSLTTLRRAALAPLRRVRRW